MSGETISPNMSLPIPAAGITGGPTWATDLNSCLTLVDSHNHSSGQGVQITPDGININSDFSLASNNLILARSLRMTPQSSVLALASDLGCLSVVGVDLYFNDLSGNKIQITQSGGIAGSPGSISNLTSPASASYVSANSTFVWQSASNTSAIMDCSSVIVRNLLANGKGVTVAAPAALASNYTVTLPAVAASGTKIVTIDTSGNLGSTYDVDNSTLQVSSSLLSVKDLGISTAKIAANAVTPAKVQALGEQISPSSGVYSIPLSATYSDVTFLTVTITTTGRPVDIRLVADGSTNLAYIQSAGNSSVAIAIVRGSTRISENQIGTPPFGSGTVLVPVSSIQHVDRVAAGTYTYKVQAATPSSVTGAAGSVRYAQLLAFEIL